MRLMLLALFTVLLLPARTIPGRFIVELADEPEARPRVRARLEQRKLKIRGSVQRVANALFVEAADAAELLALPGVKRVTAVREFKLLMDRAVVLHRVNEVWNRVGAERAGDGIKIGILDTGLDVSHPSLRDDALPALDGYPRASREGDLAFTNRKVIVARSYVDLLTRSDPDRSAADRVGHGTAVASVAAGHLATGPWGFLQGLAPGARLGSYKIFGSPGVNDATNDEAIIKAIDDAVGDGMDILNLSLGTDYAPRFEYDPVVAAVERAARAGVIVVAAAGNAGPGLGTLGSPASAPSAIAVGATTNSRVFASGIELPGAEPVLALAGDKFGRTPAVTGRLADVLPLDQNGQACAALPGGSLAGRIALIARGTCLFEVKLTNARNAGAVAAILYSTAESPSPTVMGTGTATLPAAMVSYADGLALRARLEQQAELTPTVRFTPGPLESVPFRLAAFSSSGPGVDLALKPELVATGTALQVATQRLDPQGELYSEDGFAVIQGTSFSSPMVAGAAALVKAARPGLSAGAYRSLIINTARPLTGARQQFGAGALDALAAVDSTLLAAPAALSFGATTSTRSLDLSTLAVEGETCTMEVVPAEAGPAPVAPPSLRLEPGAPTRVNLEWTTGTLAPGTYEGFVVITGTRSGQTIRVPYWTASPTRRPAAVQLVEQTASGRPGALLRDAIAVRITEETGIPLAEIEPTVSARQGGGTIRRVRSLDAEVPGVFFIDVGLGAQAGANVFRIQAGDAVLDVTINGR